MKEIYEVSDEYLNSQLKYLKLLSRKYSSVSEASAEIINLKAKEDIYLEEREK